MPAPLLYAAGIGAATAAKYGSELLQTYFKDPQLVQGNASRYFSNAPTTNMDQAPSFWKDSQSVSSPKVSQMAQFQQLQDARYRRSQGNQTGFDDEVGNTIDDNARAKAGAQQRAQDAFNRDKNNSGNTMATPDNRYNNSNNNSNQGTRIYSNKASDYALGQKLQSDYAGYQIKSVSDLQNYAYQSADRRYNTDATSNVNLQLGTQKNQADLAIGLDKNAVTRDVGYYTSDNNLKASNYKTYTDLQASLNKNQLQSGDNRYQTDVTAQTNRYGIDVKATTDKYQWDNVNQTQLAEAQVKAGTYGMSKDAQQKAASDKTNFDNWKNYNDTQFNYTNQINSQNALARNMQQADRAYNDQRQDRSNDQSAAMARYNYEAAVKATDKKDYYANQKVLQAQQQADFNLRSQQIQSQIDQANRDYALRSQLVGAQVNQIYSDTSLKNQQFAATRADVGYNRNQQGRSNLAF